MNFRSKADIPSSSWEAFWKNGLRLVNSRDSVSCLRGFYWLQFDSLWLSHMNWFAAAGENWNFTKQILKKIVWIMVLIWRYCRLTIGLWNKIFNKDLFMNFSCGEQSPLKRKCISLQKHISLRNPVVNLENSTSHFSDKSTSDKILCNIFKAKEHFRTHWG